MKRTKDYYENILCACYVYRFKNDTTDWHCRTFAFDLDGHGYPHSNNFDNINQALESNNMESFFGIEFLKNGLVKQLFLIDNPVAPSGIGHQSICTAFAAKFNEPFMSCFDHIIRTSMNSNIPWKKRVPDFKSLLDNLNVEAEL